MAIYSTGSDTIQLVTSKEAIINPTAVLIDEHRLIERVLTALERATNRLSRGEDVYLRFYSGTAYFIKGFIEGHHHRNEEDYLFPSLVESGLSKDTGPIAMLLSEHAEASRLAQAMKQMVEKYQAGDMLAREQVVKNSTAYIELMHKHIYKENNYLFPMANKMLQFQQLQKLLEAYTRVEINDDGEELHEKFTGLVQRLESECLRSG